VLAHQGEFVVDEANVERRVMDDQLAPLMNSKNSSATSAKRGLPTRKRR
jgi:hypothetical protein